MHGVEGFIYPNEVELQWGLLIVLYPFITGLVAGAFILASLERVFNVHVVKPTYRLALLTALAVGPAVADAVLADGDDACRIERGLLHVAGDILHGLGSTADGPCIAVPGLLPGLGWE